MTSRALHTFFCSSSSSAYCHNTASDVPLELHRETAAFTSCTTRHSVKSVTNRRSAGRNYTRYRHFNAISSLCHRPKRSGHPMTVTLKNLLKKEEACTYLHTLHTDFGKAFKCFHIKPYLTLRLVAVQKAHRPRISRSNNPASNTGRTLDSLACNPRGTLQKTPTFTHVVRLSHAEPEPGFFTRGSSRM